jgi:hypothetical protein
MVRQLRPWVRHLVLSNLCGGPDDLVVHMGIDFRRWPTSLSARVPSAAGKLLFMAGMWRRTRKRLEPVLRVRVYAVGAMPLFTLPLPSPTPFAPVTLLQNVFLGSLNGSISERSTSPSIRCNVGPSLVRDHLLVREEPAHTLGCVYAVKPLAAGYQARGFGAHAEGLVCPTATVGS